MVLVRIFYFICMHELLNDLNEGHHARNFGRILLSCFQQQQPLHLDRTLQGFSCKLNVFLMIALDLFIGLWTQAPKDSNCFL